jgi:hypothetical protein
VKHGWKAVDSILGHTNPLNHEGITKSNEGSNLSDTMKLRREVRLVVTRYHCNMLIDLSAEWVYVKSWEEILGENFVKIRHELSRVKFKLCLKTDNAESFGSELT